MLRFAVRQAVAPALAFTLVSCVTASSQLTPTTGAEPFPVDQLMYGSVADEALCKSIPDTVWVIVDGTGDCIRYYKSLLGHKPGGAAFIFFHGDYLGGTRMRGNLRVVGNYGNQTPARLTNQANALAKEAGGPYFLIARPGVFGSSGDHAQRRRPREPLLVNAALDQLKVRHNIGTWHISGQSGGGTMAAALITLRSDVDCVGIASGGTAIKVRARELGFTADSTGYDDPYDPVDHISKISRSPAPRIFVVSDPRDTDVSFSSQSYYVVQLTRAGLNPTHIMAEARPPNYHGLDQVAIRATRLCAKGATTIEILNELSSRHLRSSGHQHRNAAARTAENVTLSIRDFHEGNVPNGELDNSERKLPGPG